MDHRASGVLALAFPLITPRGVSRQDELDAVTVPLLIVQGTNDRFGMPADAVQVKGDHGLKADHARIAEVIRDWLSATRPSANPPSGTPTSREALVARLGVA